MTLHLTVVCGTRPNFMKVAPLLHAIDAHNKSEVAAGRIDVQLVHSGQHYDPTMSDVFFRDLDMRAPDVHLGVGSASHARQTADILVKMEDVLLARRPDVLVVVGDVNSTLGATLAAVKLLVPVAHIEAGERTYDRAMPEEINRVLIDAICDLHFAATEDAAECLLKEGIDAARIHAVGNVMIDALVASKARIDASNIRADLALTRGRYAVATLHRVANVDDPERLAGILKALREVATRIPVLFPVHPRTLARLKRFGLEGELEPLPATLSAPLAPALYALEPKGYVEFLALVKDAALVLTDSGSLQAETSFLGVPCLTLSDRTDWLVTLRQGTNELVGTQPGPIAERAFAVLRSGGPKPKLPASWDGRAAQRVLAVLLERYTQRPVAHARSASS